MRRRAGLFRTGGAAPADYDNDGWIDLFVTRLNARPLLYRNLGNGTFQDVAVTAGFTSSLPANGVAWGDIENDGDKDLYVTSSGGTRFYLYVNNGNGTFSEQAVGARGGDRRRVSLRAECDLRRLRRRRIPGYSHQ